jgi:phosphinothricin acetyltransferase
MSGFALKECGGDDLPAILDIFNHAILHTTALYEYQPRTLETLRAWYALKLQGRFPVIGAFDATGRLAGFASYGAFRPQPGFKYAVEHSVYVDQGRRGRGLGRRLLTEIISLARDQDFHVLVGAIDRENLVSVGLHASLGFTHAGTLLQAGFKFGRWLDLVLYQLILATPAAPRDG